MDVIVFECHGPIKRLNKDAKNINLNTCNNLRSMLVNASVSVRRMHATVTKAEIAERAAQWRRDVRSPDCAAFNISVYDPGTRGFGNQLKTARKADAKKANS